MSKDSIETAPPAGDSVAEKEKNLEEIVGKKFDEIFDRKKYKDKLKGFSRREKEKIDAARSELKEQITIIAMKEKWKSEEIAEKIIKESRDNIEEIAEGEGMEPAKKRKFIKIIKEICEEIKAPAANDVSEPESVSVVEPEPKIVSEEKPEEKPEPAPEPAKHEIKNNLEAGKKEGRLFKHILTRLEDGFQSRLEKIEEGKAREKDIFINPKLYLDSFLGIEWEILRKDEQDEIERRCEEYNKKLAAKQEEVKKKRGRQDRKKSPDTKKAKEYKRSVRNPNQKDSDFFESASKIRKDKKTYTIGSTPEDALEKQRRVENLKEMEKRRGSKELLEPELIDKITEKSRKFKELLLKDLEKSNAWKKYKKETQSDIINAEIEQTIREIIDSIIKGKGIGEKRIDIEKSIELIIGKI